MHGRHVSSFPFDEGREHKRAISELAGLFCSGVDGLPVAAHNQILHAGERGIAGLGSFLERRRLTQPILLDDPLGIGDGRGIGDRWARTDHVEIVADDIGKNQGDHGCRRCKSGELAALDSGHMLANSVDLMNGGAAGQELSSGLLLFRERDGRRRSGHQRGGASGDQAYE